MSTFRYYQPALRLFYSPFKLTRLARLVFTLALLTFSIFIINTPVASAHGDSPVTFSPAQSATLPVLPAEVKITFTDALNSSTGELSVKDPSGKNLANSVIVTPTTIESKLDPSFYAGTYLISYRVLSMDGTTLTNTAKFYVLPGPKYQVYKSQSTQVNHNALNKKSDIPFLAILSTFIIFIFILLRKKIFQLFKK